MFVEKPEPTPEMLAKAEALEAEAKRSRQRAEESFQRSDTDGFLSQWASNIGAEKDCANAAILRNGGCSTFPVLCDADGNVLATREHSFPDFNRPWLTVYRWKLPREYADKCGRKWVPVGEKSRVQKQLGLHEETRWFRAEARITTGNRKSTGLSGCANAYVATFQADDSE
jgi:hypothetical protein